MRSIIQNAARLPMVTAASGMRVCRVHGGLSTGPRTQEGRERCTAARTVHGLETRQKRRETSSVLLELYEVEMLGRAAGVIVGSPVRGRKPKA